MSISNPHLTYPYIIKVLNSSFINKVVDVPLTVGGILPQNCVNKCNNTNSATNQEIQNMENSPHKTANNIKKKQEHLTVIQ